MTGTTPVRTLTMCVVICAYTFDRWDDVLAAVASVRSQKTAPEEIVVVVDHNPDLYSRLRPVLPDVTVVENRYQRGLSGGKNTGVEVTSSDVVAFLDDDAVAHPDWLGHLRDAYVDDCIVGVGGTTLPLWESARPRWFPEEFDWVLGCTFTGREPGPVRNVLGGNASFRREVFSVCRWVPDRHRADVGAESSPRLRGDGVLHPGEPAPPRLDVRLRTTGGDLAPRAGRPRAVRLFPLSMLRRGVV